MFCMYGELLLVTFHWQHVVCTVNLACELLLVTFQVTFGLCTFCVDVCTVNLAACDFCMLYEMCAGDMASSYKGGSAKILNFRI